MPVSQTKHKKSRRHRKHVKRAELNNKEDEKKKHAGAKFKHDEAKSKLIKRSYDNINAMSYRPIVDMRSSGKFKQDTADFIDEKKKIYNNKNNISTNVEKINEKENTLKREKLLVSYYNVT